MVFWRANSYRQCKRPSKWIERDINGLVDEEDPAFDRPAQSRCGVEVDHPPSELGRLRETMNRVITLTEHHD